MTNNDIVVSIRCTVYNHAKYLRQCLNGIVNQKANFKFEAIVHDDASTDGSTDIIMEFANKYPSIIKPIIQSENQYKKGFSVIRETVTKACRGKYMAWCEGDDYWLDPYKLQKQVDVLDNNINIGLVYGRARQFVEKKGKFKKQSFGSVSVSPKDLLISNTIPTVTAMVRKSLYDQYMDEKDIQSQNWLMGDYPLWIYLSLHSDISFLNEDLAVYRILEESACHSNDRNKLECFYKSAIEMKKFMNDKFNIVDKRIIEDQYNELLLLNAVQFGDRKSILLLFSRISSPTLIVRIFYLLSRFRLLYIYKIYKKYL